MRHSRAAALLTGDYLDRTIELGITTSVGAGAAGLLLGTYTVGANIQSRLEETFIYVDASTAAQTVSVQISMNRDGVLRVLELRFSIAGALSTFSTMYDLLLRAGDIIQIYANNADAAARVIIDNIYFREIDL